MPQQLLGARDLHRPAPPAQIVQGLDLDLGGLPLQGGEGLRRAIHRLHLPDQLGHVEHLVVRPGGQQPLHRLQRRLVRHVRLPRGVEPPPPQGVHERR